jgi:hypothetical protein
LGEIPWTPKAERDPIEIVEPALDWRRLLPGTEGD